MKHIVKEYLVTMYNEFGCVIDADEVLAIDEEDAVQNYIRKNNPIIYIGDRFKAVEC